MTLIAQELVKRSPDLLQQIIRDKGLAERITTLSESKV